MFQNSIGRTDLPGDDFDTLIRSIKEKLFPLEDDLKVYPRGMGLLLRLGMRRGIMGFWFRFRSLCC